MTIPNFFKYNQIMYEPSIVKVDDVRKTWTPYTDHTYCPHCGWHNFIGNILNYCPNCGNRMRRKLDDVYLATQEYLPCLREINELPSPQLTENREGFYISYKDDDDKWRSIFVKKEE